MEFRTDMALERNEMYKQQNKLQQIDGVEIENDWSCSLRVSCRSPPADGVRRE